MSSLPQGFASHIATGSTTLCRAWAITRLDGVEYGFTDHDLPLTFEGIAFKADTGLTASALQQSTGLSVDNSEAVGALSDFSLTEADIVAGRFDNATVRSWLVNWQKVEERCLQFRGTIGELRRSGGAFHAELRGLTESLNKPLGRVYQKPCTAVMGDAGCGLDATGAVFQAEAVVRSVSGDRILQIDPLPEHADDWFSRGRVVMQSGAAQGLFAAVKSDVSETEHRVIELWEPMRIGVAVGDVVQLTAGCDKRAETCRAKFDNFANFQGFPDIPGEDWLISYPKSSGTNTGGSLR